MVRTNLPVYVEPSRPVREQLGNEIAAVAVLAVRAILKNQRGLEVAYQQIAYRGHHLALSSRITSSGDLVVALDIGDPQRAGRLVLENELREAERKSRDEDKKVRDARRKLHHTRRW